MPSSFTLSLPEEFVAELIRQEIKLQVAERLAKTPPSDQQYTVAEVALILNIAEETVRGYFKLPRPHPRQLPYMIMTDDARGRRVRTSDLVAWQQRNVSSSIPLELPVRRPPNRRPANRRS